jgi:hypothetical protein
MNAKRLFPVVFQVVLLAPLALGQKLPQVWVDNNEATDGSVESYTITSHGSGCISSGNLSISAPPAGGTQATGTFTCASGSLTGITITNPGEGYTSNPTVRFGNTNNSPCNGCAVNLTVNTPPAYELALGSSTWISGPPPSYCTFSLPYAATAAGKQAAINAIEACRTAGIAHSAAVGIILDVPPGTYTSSNGVLIPQTSNTLATTFLIVRSTMDSQLKSMPEPVCAGGIQDNISESTAIGLINSDCQAGAGRGTFGYQLADTVTTIPSGPFTLANGTPTNSSNYNYLQYMYQDECTAATKCIPLQLCSSVSGVQCTSTVMGPDHWLFEDGAEAFSPGNTTDNSLVSTGVGIIGAATSTSQFASHIHFRRIWAHGDWTTLTAGANSVSAGFDLGGCYYCSVVGSQVSQALRPGAEGHSISTQGFELKIDNDWLEGSSSGIFAGGFGSPPALLPTGSYVPFQDVQIGRVRNTFPYSWLGVYNSSCYNPSGTIPPGNSNWGCGSTKGSGYSIVRKNCEEFKEGERVLIYGFICENVDNSGGQRGIVSGINVRNTSGGGANPTNYQTTINDVTIQNAIFRNSCEGMGFDGRSASASGDGGGVGYVMDRVSLSNILQYNVTDSNFNSTTTGACPSGNSVGMALTNGGGGQTWQGTITENPAGTGATFVASCSQNAGGCMGQISATINNAGTACSPGTLTFSAPTGPSGAPSSFHINPSDTAAATYLCNSGGTALSSINITNPGAYYVAAPTVTGLNCTGCSVTWNYNVSTSVSSSLGFQVMDIYAGDPLGISNCTEVPAFNLQTKGWSASGNSWYWPTEVQAFASSATTPWSGSFVSGGVTVPYNWTAAAGATDNAGWCTLTTAEGGPENLTINHMTFITDANETIGEGPSLSNGPQFSRDHAFVNSIMLSDPACNDGACPAGWYNTVMNNGSGGGEGYLTEIFDYDFTSMTAAWLVWPGRTGSLYYEYGNNPSFADASCTTETGCNPPVTMYFPATSCAVDFVDSCSGPLPLTLNDYHEYALSSSSPYHDGASDHTDIGAIIPSLDTAQTTTLYVCGSSCGTLGPYPD